MGSYLNQLKSLVIKNYIIKKAGPFKRILFFQVLVQIFLIVPLNFTKNSHYIFKEENSIPSIPLNFINFKSTQGTISFLIPPDSNGNGNREKLVNNLVNNKEFFENPLLKYKIFDDENSFNKFNDGIMSGGLVNRYFVASVIFNNNSNYTDYTIRVPWLSAVDTKNPTIESYYKQRKKEQTSDKYLLIFTPVQAIVNQAIIQTKTNKPINIDVAVGKLSKAEVDFEMYDYDVDVLFFKLKSYVYPLLFILQTYYIMMGILDEKEKGQEQGLIAIGVHPSTIWLSWEIVYLPINLFVTLTTTLIEINILFKHVNIILGFLLIFVYSTTCYGFAVLLTKLTKNKKEQNNIISKNYY